MTIASLKFISDLFSEIGIEYQFSEWNTDPVPNPYFVGEYTEPESATREESGFQESTFILTGTGTSRLKLEEAKEKIERALPKSGILPNGSGIAVYYSGANTIPTADAEYRRLQINLTINEWMVI